MGNFSQPKGKTNIGLMGGTFDPIHIGHLVSAEEARQQFNLDYVIFVPAGLPPHKDIADITSPEHRYLMTNLAIMSNPFFRVSRFEIDRPQPSYTLDTVMHYSKGEESNNIFFITGADAILEIPTWKNCRQLLELCVFIAVSRPGYTLAKLKETLGEDCSQLIQKIHLLEIPALSISSTFIRERVALGKTIRYLTPEPVEQYIVKHHLYLQRC